MADGRIVVRVVSDDEGVAASDVREPHAIVRDMVAATEIRGGQAGGLSAFAFGTVPRTAPAMGRVRVVGRKRRALAGDLANRFKRACPQGRGAHIFSVVGHTRFATGSRNVVHELHPHDWPHSGLPGERPLPVVERVWSWCAASGVPRPMPCSPHGATLLGAGTPQRGRLWPRRCRSSCT